MTERSYWLGFSIFPGIGPKKFQLLLKEFGSAENAWSADLKSLERTIGPALTHNFADFKKTFSISDYEKKLKNADVWYVALFEERFPKLLSQIKDPPLVLYGKGDYEFNSFENQRTIAIVGTRKITQYGRDVTESLTTGLVNSNFVVVSGLALGVDAAAHKTTVENNGRTIAVLGCGVDCISPHENTALYNMILRSGGAVVSEYPLSQPPTKGSFPSRNRIISGLSLGVIVTEGAEDSGALYTAEDAFNNGRPVFAVPGPITSSLSKGPNGLISKGAKLISSLEDVLKELNLSTKLHIGKKAEVKGDTKEEQKIINLLENDAMQFDEIHKKTSINPAKLGTILSMMEVKGMIRVMDTGHFSL